jgi:two-component system chemotaxis response regulator CheB
MPSLPKFIVVIGTSAGGLSALEELFMQLTTDLDAAFFVVLHLSRKVSSDELFQRLGKSSILPCVVAINNEPIERGRIYLAPPDHHMLLGNDEIIIGEGAPENRWRPSVNNLFRSAAAMYSSRVIGIILTGLLDDGTSGMSSIKRAGGISIVQEPNEAEYPDMPLYVLENVDVDYIRPLLQMGQLLKDIMATVEPREVHIPYDLKAEAGIDQKTSIRIDNLSPFEKIEINCPDCGGGLYMTQKEHPSRYRCHVGHSYTDKELLFRMSEVMESTFWVSLRMLEERRTLLMKLAKKDKERGHETTADIYLKRAREMEIHIKILRQLLFSATSLK